MFPCNVVNEALDVGDGDPVALQGEVTLKRMQPKQFFSGEHRALSSILELYLTKKVLCRAYSTCAGAPLVIPIGMHGRLTGATSSV